MKIDKNPTVTEWLNKAQIKTLLASGELVVTSRSGTLRLYVDYCDRVAVAALVRKRTPSNQP